MKKHQLAVAVLATLLGITGNAHAATATTTLDVSVSVQGACSVSATGIVFPYIPNDLASANGDVTVTCPAGMPYAIALDAGQHSNGQYRQVVNNTSSIPYELYKDQIGGNVWGDADYGQTYLSGTSLADTGNGLPQPHAVLGVMGFTGGEQPGEYTDAVIVSVNY